MSQNTKLVLGIVALVVVLGGAYWYWQSRQTPTASNDGSSTEVTSLPSGSNTSDTALEEDMASIDTQIKAVASDNTQASQSVDAAAAAQ